MKKNLIWRLLLLVLALLAGSAQLSQADPLDNWHWKNPLPQGNTIRGMVHDGAQYIAVGEYGAIVTSTDGVNWVNRTQLNSGQSGTRSTLRGVAAQTISGTLTEVAVGDNGTILWSQPVTGVAGSADQPAGAVWSVTASHTSAALTGVTFGDGQFVAVAADGTFVTSADGKSWSSPAAITSDSINAIAYGVIGGAKYFVAVTNNGNIYSAKNPVSSGGWSWIKAVAQTSNSLRTVVFDGDLQRFVATGVGGTVVASTDGTSWTVLATPTLPQSDYNALLYASSTYVVCGNNGAIYSSPDAATWSDGTSNTNSHLFTIAGNGAGEFMIGGGNGQVLAATDPTASWSLRSSNVVFGAGVSQHFNAVGFGNGQAVAAGTGSSVVTVSDLQQRTAVGSYNGVAYGNNTFVVAGVDGVMYRSVNGGVTWQRLVSLFGDNFTPKRGDNVTHETVFGITFDAGRFVAVGANGSVTYSSDNGSSWSAASTGSRDLFSVAYGAGTFVAVGSAGTIQTSADAGVWTIQNSPTVEYLNAVTFGSGTFVAVGANGTILVSGDGLGWARMPSPSAGNLTGISYGNGVFAAVGSDGSKGVVLTSADNGATWTERASGSANALNAVAFGGNVFYAVGANGTVIYSDPVPSPPATVTSTTPADGAIGVDVNTAVTATFSSAMEPDSFTGNFTLQDADGKAVAGAVLYDALTMRATFTPDAALLPSQTYTATLSTGVTDKGGNALKRARVWQFTTGDASTASYTVTVSSSGPGSITPGTITLAKGSSQDFTVTAAAGYGLDDLKLDGTSVKYLMTGNTYTLTNISASHTLTATFNKAYQITTSAGANGSVTMYAKAGYKPEQFDRLALQGVTALNTDHGRLYWQLAGTAGTRGFKLFKDAAGTALVASGSSSADGLMTLASENSSGITGSVAVTYSEDSSATATNTIDVAGVSAANSPLTVTVNSGVTRYFTFTPDSGFVVASVSDSGAALPTPPPASYTLTDISADHQIFAGFAIDITPPSVTAVTPLAGASNVSPVVVLTATFSKAMDPTSISNNTFIVKDAAGNSIPGTVSYSKLIATFTSQVTLALNTEYTATITTSVADLFGNKPVAPFVWKFTVAKDVQYLTVLPTVNGTVSPSGVIPVPKGSNQTFTITTDPEAFNFKGSALLDITVDNGSIGQDKVPLRNPVTGTYSYTTDSVDTDHTIGFVFTSATHQLTASSYGRGEVSNGSNEAGLSDGLSGGLLQQTTLRVNHGDSTTWTLIPNHGYMVASITFNGLPQAVPPTNLDNSVTYTTPRILSDANFLATFTDVAGSEASNLTVQAGGGGIIYFGAVTLVGGLNGDGSYRSSSFPCGYGKQATFRITTQPGYALASILQNGVAVAESRYLPRLGDGSYTFTTDPISTPTVFTVTFSVDTTKPVVVNTVPAAGATAVAVAQPPIKATFSKPINPATITPVNFGLKETVSGTPVAGTLSYDAGTQTATFLPTMPLKLATGYTVTLSSGISDNFGNPLSNGKPDRPDEPLTFTFSTRSSTHQVTLGVGDHGTVTSTPPAAGSTVVVNDNDDVVLTIAPVSSGPHPWYMPAIITVDGVPVAVPAPGSDGKYVYTLSNVIADHKVGVTFSQLTHTIAATVESFGGVSGSPALDYSGKVVVYDGDTVTLTFTPSSGYGLSSVTDNGTHFNLALPPYGLQKSGTRNADGTYNWTYTFSATADHVVSAGFANSFRITVDAGSGGSITPGNTVVSYGSDKAFTVTANPGYYITGVLVNGQPAYFADKGSSVFTFTQITADQTLSASFAPYQYHIDVTPSASGTITPGGTIYRDATTDTYFTITPATGYDLSGIVVDGELIKPGTPNSYGVYGFMLEAREKSSTLAATFTQKSYTVKMYSMGNGSLSSGSVTASLGSPQSVSVLHGGAITIKILPKDSYFLKSLTLEDGTSLMPQVVNDSVTLLNVTGDQTVTATFGIKYKVTATAGPHGTVSPPGVTVYTAGAKPTYTYSPDVGYEVQSVKTNGEEQLPIPPSLTLEMTKDWTVEVAFALKTFNVTLTDNVTNGSMFPASAKINYLDSQSFTLVPDKGYVLKDVILDKGTSGQTSVWSNVQSNILFLNKVTDNHTVTPVFQPIVYTITTQASTGGTISGETHIAYNLPATFTIKPDDHYSLLDLKLDGVSVKSQLVNGQLKIDNVTAAHTLSATFAMDTFVIQAVAGNGGTISPAGSTTLNYGTNQAYAISPADGYTVNDVVVDGVSVKGSLVNGSYSFNGVNAGHSITATFMPIVYPDGDLNGDGKVGIEDALLALQMAVGNKVPTQDQLVHGDVAPLSGTGKPRPDQKIDLADALVLLQRAVGNIQAW